MILSPTISHSIWLRSPTLDVAVVEVDTRPCCTFGPWSPSKQGLALDGEQSWGQEPVTSWIRPPGRPRRTWLNLVQEDANAIPLSSLWRTEIFWGHGAAQRSVRTTRRWWWWMLLAVSGTLQARNDDGDESMLLVLVGVRRQQAVVCFSRPKWTSPTLRAML